MEFKPLKPEELKTLNLALDRNANDGAALLMSTKDTSFAGMSDEAIEEEKAISAIRSIPCHY